MGMPFAGIGKINQPPHSQRELTVSGDLHRQMISGSTHPSRLNFEPRLGIVNRPLQNFHGVGCRVLFGELLKRAIYDALGNAFQYTLPA